MGNQLRIDARRARVIDPFPSQNNRANGASGRRRSGGLVARTGEYGDPRVAGEALGLVAGAAAERVARAAGRFHRLLVAAAVAQAGADRGASVGGAAVGGVAVAGYSTHMPGATGTWMSRGPSGAAMFSRSAATSASGSEATSRAGMP